MSDLMIMESRELSVETVRQQINKIQSLMESVMQKDQHYGVIPGTSKPCLLKAGAEKLKFTFRLVSRYEIKRTDLQGGHREYETICSLYQMGTDILVGQGVGTCSTMETKYRYRKADADYEILDEPIPDDYRQKKADYRKKGLGCKQVNGSWVWVKFGDAQKIENPDIADTYNTVMKMSKKRADVDATISACAASDIFTQDIDEDYEPLKESHKEPQQGQDTSGSMKDVTEPLNVEELIQNSNLPEGKKADLIKQYNGKPENLKKPFYEGCILPQIKGPVKTANRQAESVEKMFGESAFDDKGVPFETYAAEHSTTHKPAQQDIF